MNHLAKLRRSFSYKAIDFPFGPDDPHYKLLQEFQDEQLRLIHDMHSLHERPAGAPSETWGHSTRVAEDTYNFTLHIGLSKQIADNIKWATLLHDIGKLDVPVEILDKPGKLTEAEFVEMKRHTRYGVNRIKSLGIDHPLVNLAADIALYHHERHDGLGYYALKGDEIPSRVRLVQLCDIYDAVSAPRVYRTEKEQLSPYQVMKNILDPHGFLHGAVDMRFARPFCLLKVNLMEGDLSKDHHKLIEDYLIHPEHYPEDDWTPSVDEIRVID
jgi:hypothetical protein